MREWQFEQVTSNSCDIGDPPILVLVEEYTDRFYTPNAVFWLHSAPSIDFRATKRQYLARKKLGGGCNCGNNQGTRGAATTLWQRQRGDHYNGRQAGAWHSSQHENNPGPHDSQRQD